MRNQKLVQINAQVPSSLKQWAKERADDNFQSLSGYIAKILNNEKQRIELMDNQNLSNQEFKREGEINEK